MNLPKCLLLIPLFLVYACAQKQLVQTQALPVGMAINEEALLQTIAFGSCNRQDLDQPMWTYIHKDNPDLWIWLGDNIYADTENMAALEAMYAQQKSKAGYQKLLNSCPVIGIWDDHDYGLNDGGKEFSKKSESKDLMLNFLDVQDTAAVRSRTGAYQSYTIGPAGKRVKIILLDTRYFRDGLKPDPSPNNRYFPNPEGDILGEAQWQWLETELRNSDAQLHLIASSIQVLPQEHGYEKWSNFPTARQRLLDLLAAVKPGFTLLLSGDRHLAEVSKTTVDGLPYPLYEVTSSGLTHSYEEANEPNQYRVSALVGQKNYGLLQIDWSGTDPAVSVQIKGLNDQIFINLPVK